MIESFYKSLGLFRERFSVRGGHGTIRSGVYVDLRLTYYI